MIKSILLLICITSLACAQVVGPKASSQQKEFDFGSVEQGKTAAHNFIIVNNGGDILKITDVHASCGCTVAKPDKSELAPGESTNIKVEFNSTGRSGKQEKMIYVKTNDPDNKELVFKFTGNVATTSTDKVNSVAPQLYLPESLHDFGTVKEGQVVDYTFKFVNKGKGTLEVSNVSTSCGCTVASISSKKLEPGKDGTLRVELDTKGKQGKLTRNITIQSNDPTEPNKILIIAANIILENK